MQRRTFIGGMTAAASTVALGAGAVAAPGGPPAAA